MAAATPQEAGEFLEEGPAFQLGVDGEYLGVLRVKAGQHQLRKIPGTATVQSQKLIQGGQSCGDLQDRGDGLCEPGKIRGKAPGVAGIKEILGVQSRPAGRAALPARGREGFSRPPHQGDQGLLGRGNLLGDFGEGEPEKLVVPAHMVIAVQPQLMAGRNNQAGDLRGRGMDQGRGQQGTVAHGLEAINRWSPGAQHLLEKSPLPENPKDSTAGVVRPQGQKEAGPDPLLLQDLKQGGHPGSIAFQGVDIHLEVQARWRSGLGFALSDLGR